MKIFIAGTDTNVGKTVVSSWLCLQTGYDYFKPIQTGVSEGRDSVLVSQYTNAHIYPEAYCYQAPLSPHTAAKLENQTIDIQRIQLPTSEKLIVEGAGGVLVPINANTLMVDLIKQFNIPLILVASSRLGMINHTLLSLEALRARHIDVLGVVVTGEPNDASCEAIEEYGNTTILAQLPFLPNLSKASLGQIPLGSRLTSIMTPQFLHYGEAI